MSLLHLLAGGLLTGFGGTVAPPSVITHEVDFTESLDGSLFTTGSFTPNAGDLLVVFIRGSSAGGTPVLTTSAGLTFTLAQAASTITFSFVANALAQAVPQTLTMDFGVGVVLSIAATVLGVAGVTKVGAAAVKQVDTDNGGVGTTPTMTFPAPTVATNPIVGMVGNTTNPAGVTPPAGFAEHSDIGTTSTNIGLETISRDAGAPVTLVTWGSVSATAWRSAGVELDATPAIPPPGPGGTGDGYIPWRRRRRS